MERRAFLKGIAGAIGASLVSNSHAGNLIAGHSRGDIYEMKQIEILSNFDILYRLNILSDEKINFRSETSFEGLSTSKNIIAFGNNTILEVVKFESMSNLGYVPRTSVLYYNGTKLGAKRYEMDDGWIIYTYAFEGENSRETFPSTIVAKNLEGILCGKKVYSKDNYDMSKDFVTTLFNEGPIPGKMTGIVSKLS